jgi:hypothetical protein
METICAQLDPMQISKVFLLLLSPDYVNAHAAKEFQLEGDLHSHYFLSVCYMNASHFKKVQIVKEFIAPLSHHIALANNMALNRVRLMHKYVELNNRMLIQGSPKLKRLLEILQRKIDAKEEEEAVDALVAPSMEESEQMLEAEAERYRQFFDDEVLG